MRMAAGGEQSASARDSGREPWASVEQGRKVEHGSMQAAEAPLVLVAEDEEPIAAALMLIIEDAGYTPLVAAHGKAALDLIRTRRPGLVITDLMMPYLDGADLIAAIHDEAERNHSVPPPIVLMTAAGPRRAQEVGADAVLRKPFDIEDVEALLHRFLGADNR